VSRYFADRASKNIVFICAFASIIILIAIFVFIFKEGLPVFRQVGILDFLFGTQWRPGIGEYGVLPMILGSLYVTFGAMLIAIPLGIGCAILLAEVAPFKVRQILRPAVELLVGIPSVVYGLVGLLLVVPAVRHIGGNGFSIMAASIVLAAMILPTVISISEDSIRAVPRSYKEGSLAMGATQWQTIWHVLLPAARSGITASVILGMGRAVGETMAMIMVIGNSVKIPVSPLDSGRTLTGNIAAEITYADPEHMSALFATGIVLFFMIIVLNSIALIVLKRGVRARAVE
jgi:phosphate transport system permease protein